jgi:polysaccharide export outer membrane protein
MRVERGFVSIVLAALLSFLAFSAPVRAQVGADASPPAMASADSDAAYILAPGDKVKILVYDEDDLSGEYVVSPSGIVSLPLVGDVHAGGLSISAFQSSVQNALQPKYLKDAKVSVQLLSLRPFYILGEVSKPGQYPYVSGLTVLDAVATAGGFTYRANTHRVFIKHANDSSEQKYPLTSATAISVGDTIRIEERHF